MAAAYLHTLRQGVSFPPSLEAAGMWTDTVVWLTASLHTGVSVWYLVV